MNVFSKIIKYFDGLSRDIRLLNLKQSLIFSCIFFISGIISWILCGSVDDVTVFLIFPRCALPLIYSYILWGVGFLFIGFVFSGTLFGCERYRRTNAYKIALFIVITHVFTLCAYPVLFGACAPLFAFLLLLLSFLFCFLALMVSFKQYCLWTICILLYSCWLLYNAYSIWRHFAAVLRVDPEEL